MVNLHTFILIKSKAEESERKVILSVSIHMTNTNA